MLQFSPTSAALKDLESALVCHHRPAQLFSVTLLFSALSLQEHFGLLSATDFPTQWSLALVYMFPIKVISPPLPVFAAVRTGHPNHQSNAGSPVSRFPTS